MNLNIGGVKYTTTLNTLLKQPNSLLAKWFADADSVFLKDNDGNYFLDRDGRIFRYILQLLRGPEFVFPDDDYDLNLLLVEVKYFRLELPIDRAWGFIKDISREDQGYSRYYISNRPIYLKTAFSIQIKSTEEITCHIRQKPSIWEEEGSIYSWKFKGTLYFRFDATEKLVSVRMEGGQENIMRIKAVKLYFSFENKGEFKLNFLDK